MGTPDTTPPPEKAKPARVKASSGQPRQGLFFQLSLVVAVALVIATLFTAWTPSGSTDAFPTPVATGLAIALEPSPTFPPGLPTPTLSNPRLVGLVAGHWKNDSGSVCSDGLKEVDVNLQIATLVQKTLTGEGYQVELLHEFDPRLAGYQAAALISIHNDSCDFINNEATGFKVASAMATRHPERAARLTSCLRARYGAATNLPLHSTSVTLDMTSYHAFEEINENTPASIIETGFMNLDRQILTEQPERVAQGVAEGILCYLRNEPITGPTVVPPTLAPPLTPTPKTPPPPPFIMPTQPLPVSSPENLSQANQAVRQARQALQQGDSRQARSSAFQATRLAPELEDGWLLLAAVSSARASLAYLERALEINPTSQRARAGMHWALQRTRSLESASRAEIAPAREPIPASETDAAVKVAATVMAVSAAQPAPIAGPVAAPQPAGTIEEPIRVPAPPPARRPPRRTSPWAGVSLALALFLLCLASGFFLFSWWPVAGPALSQAQGYALALVYSPTPAPSQTPLPTETPLPTPTASPSATVTPTATPVPTDTPIPTETPTPLPTATHTPPPTPTFTATNTQPPPTPTAKPVAAKKNKGKKNPTVGLRPGPVQLNDRWIDVDLSSQTVFAMQGDQVVNRFLVSTGRWPTVTVTGVYRVYVKYSAADMSGDDYYLPDVPYVMYFYKGYGLHGTYWHNNFGVPMSHGCVNLRTPDAGWLFDWASVGTVVSVHE